MYEKVYTAIINAFALYYYLFRSSLKVINRICIYIQNYYKEESICRELVQISLVPLGPRDPDILNTVYRLATAIRDRDCYSKSKQLQYIAI